MQQQQQTTHARPATRRTTLWHMARSRTARIILFIILLLAIIATGVVALITGATSPSTISTGILTIIVAIVAVMQIYPIFFPTSSTSILAAPTNPPHPVHPPGMPTAPPIFFFNLPLRNPDELYGRAAERTTLINRTANRGSSSIVGERRIGKTWLLTYLQLIAPTHPQLGPAYRVAYISAAHPECKHLTGFVQRTLEELKVPLRAIDSSQPPLHQLSQAVRDFKQQGIAPVLCIDEFEGISNRQEFTSDFFEGLRTLAQDEGLVLITASKRTLKEIIEDLTGQTSPLFNIIQQIRLHAFTEQEAREFVRAKSSKAAFNDREQELFLDSGKLYHANGKTYWPPIRLQLAGQMLLDEKQAALASPAGYHAEDIHYQHEFMRRLDDAYQAVVRI